MDHEQPTLPGMQPDPVAAEPAPGVGHTPLQKVVALGAAGRAPLLTGLVASSLLDGERDPVKRHELSQLRIVSFVLAGVGAVVGLIALVVILSAAGSQPGFGGGGGGGGGGGVSIRGNCQGQPVRDDYENITYESDDNVHWTGIYPCSQGGATRLAARPGEVP